MRRRSSFARILGGGIAAGGRMLTRIVGERIGTRAAAHAAAAMAPVLEVESARGRLRFWCASEISAKRALGALRHEPDTLAWIDSYVGPGEHLWDVGANIGVYALYACANPQVSATCFEPVASTFAILARNAALNASSERITALCIALSDADGIMPLYLADSEPGSSMHALRKAQNVRGAFDAAAIQRVAAFRGEMLVTYLGATPPRHLKIDVDGHECQVLRGMGPLLDNVKTIWLEMTEFGNSSGENARIRALLTERGFAERRASQMSPGRNSLFVKAIGRS